MHWHPDTNSSASKFYGKKVGRRLLNKANLSSIRRGKLTGLHDQWLDAYYQKFECQPTQIDSNIALDNPGKMEADIEAWTKDQKTYRVRHNGDTCGCRKCKSERPMSAKSWDALYSRVKKQNAAKQEEKLKEKLDREEVERILDEKWDIKVKCKIPSALIHKVGRGEIGPDIMIGAYGISENYLEKILWAYGYREK